jgi:predicted DNA-binding transcriptional regulator AlpA
MNHENRPRIKEADASRYIGMSRPWLRLKRMSGQEGGPPFIKISRSVVYDVRDLDAWLDRHRVGA